MAGSILREGVLVALTPLGKVECGRWAFLDGDSIGVVCIYHEVIYGDDDRYTVLFNSDGNRLRAVVKRRHIEQINLLDKLAEVG